MKFVAPATCPTCGHTERVDCDEDGEAHFDITCVVCDRTICPECQVSVPGVGAMCGVCKVLEAA